MAAALPFVMFAGAMMQTYSQIKQGEAASAAAEEDARMQTKNADLSREQAGEEEKRQRILNTKRLGSMRAAYGASGLSLEGSPEDVLVDSAKNAELDALSIRHAGELKARGFNDESIRARNKAATYRDNAYFGAAGTLLGGAGQSYYYSSSSPRRAG
jgi:hypothetical protein